MLIAARHSSVAHPSDLPISNADSVVITSVMFAGRASANAATSSVGTEATTSRSATSPRKDSNAPEPSWSASPQWWYSSARLRPARAATAPGVRNAKTSRSSVPDR